MPFACLTLNLRMMKKIWCWSVAILLLMPAFAQVDSLQKIKSDSSALTLSIDSPISKLAVTNAKYPVYKLKPAVDIPVIAVGAGWSLYAFTKIYSKDSTSAEDVLSLNKNDINKFDRWAVRP